MQTKNKKKNQTETFDNLGFIFVSNKIIRKMII